MKYQPLTQEQLIRVIEGRGNASRVPSMLHFWIDEKSFPASKQQALHTLLQQYPMDAQVIPLNMPKMFDAPMDNKSYRWSYRDATTQMTSLDNNGVIEDWDEELTLLLEDFPNPDYPALIPTGFQEDGRYRLGQWFYFFFERFWSLRGMENALMDFYLNPEAVHALFAKLTKFYKRVLTRAKETLHLDGIFTSDDLGGQTSTIFSPAIFDEFFLPYYQEVIDHAHSLGMHFWLHTCGNVEKLFPRFVQLGIDVIHPIQKHTLCEKNIAENYGEKITIWSGFDVQQTIPFGTVEDVKKETEFLMDTFARADGRFILTLGNFATGDTPLDSLEALFEHTFAYGPIALQKKDIAHATCNQ